jgi:hydroxypyruvate isomerase
MNVSVCIDAVFSGKDFIQSLKDVSASGVKAFEFWSWWDKDLTRIRHAKDELGLEVAACCTKFISLVDASRRADYLAGLQESLLAARALGCKRLISQVGNDLGSSRFAQKRALIEGLKTCVPLLEKDDVTLVIEPLNTLVDHPGYYLSSSDEAFEIVEAVGSSRVKVLFDIYHQQITEGNLIQRITDNLSHIGHFHAAGNPGRRELYVGEINYPAVFKAIDQRGYPGYVGFEYFPIEEPTQGIRAFVNSL